MTDEALYGRGISTAVECWSRFARSVDGAAVHRRRHVDVAVFSQGPEKAIYNNAVLARGMGAAERDEAVGAMEDIYATAGVAGYAAWVHEGEIDTREELARRGYRVATSTRAMGMQRQGFRDFPSALEIAAAGWPEHKRIIDVDPTLLGAADLGAFEVLVASEAGESVATGMSFDFEGDCGIYNVTTVESARRRGIGAALTAKLVRDAWRRGCETATLQATPVAERVYASVGFRDLGRIVEYTRDQLGPELVSPRR
jgi:GNAT superfamily N-acetyltransferase